VVLDQPGSLALRELTLVPPGDPDVVVEVLWTGVSTGTERLLWTGRMPPFPGLGYPLVPGYEAVGRVVEAGASSGRQVGDQVFVPGSTGFREARGLFGAAARRLVVAGARTLPVEASTAETACLLALAATARRAMTLDGVAAPPDLIVGHGALGRLLARLTVASGAPPPMVWEVSPHRMDGAEGYVVLNPEQDERRDYRRICDVSGQAGLVDELVGRLARGGEVVLAGFYDRVSFAFPAAFLKEARLRVSAEWSPPDLAATAELVRDGRLSLEGLITHRREASEARAAYDTAFEDPTCVKMILDWKAVEGVGRPARGGLACPD
jgi:bacteriochlorophyllide a dehydrogenase